MRLADLFAEVSIIPELRGRDQEEILGELAEGIAAARDVAVNAEGSADALREREATASTAVGEGIALPHGRASGIRRLVGAMGRSPAGIDFDAADGLPTKLFFAVLTPASEPDDVLWALGSLSRLLRAQPHLKGALLEALSASAMHQALAAAEGHGE